MKFTLDMLGQLSYLTRSFEFVTSFVPRVTQLLSSFAVRYLCTECVWAAAVLFCRKAVTLVVFATTSILMLEMCKFTTRHSGMLKFTHTIKNFEIQFKHTSFLRYTVENDDFLKNSYFSYFRPPKLLTVQSFIHQWKALLICYKLV